MGFERFSTGTVAIELQAMYQQLQNLEQFSQALTSATRAYQASMNDEVSEKALALIQEYDGYVKRMREICHERLYALEQGLGIANRIEGNMANKLGS